MSNTLRDVANELSSSEARNQKYSDYLGQVVIEISEDVDGRLLFKFGKEKESSTGINLEMIPKIEICENGIKPIILKNLRGGWGSFQSPTK